MKCDYCLFEAEYRYEEQNMCGECLFEALVDNGEITASTETTYYIDGEYIGDTCSGLGMGIDEIIDYFEVDIEEVETNE